MTQEIQPVIQGHIVTSWPPITVMIITYNRPKIIRRTIDAYKEHLRYDGPLIWRLADDGSPPGYLEDLAADYPELDLKWTVTDRLGLASNINRGLKAYETKYAFFTEDDWMCTRSIDLNRGITLLENVSQIAVVIFDTASYYVTLHAHSLKVNGEYVNYFIKDFESRYWYPGHPHLEHQGFYKAYGYYVEGTRHGEAERAFTYQAREIKDGPEVAILPDYVGKSPFKHIGPPRRK